MGSSTQKIETVHIPESSLQYPDPPLPHRYHPPFRKFGKVQERKKGRYVTYNINITDPFHQSIKTSFELYDKLYDAFTSKTQKIFVQSAIRQQNIEDRWLFQIDNDGTKQTMMVRPYPDTASHSFAGTLCQLYFINAIGDLACNNLHRCLDNFTIETGMNVLAEPNSHIIIMERIDSTLSQIITFKRSHKWNWTVPQFYRLTSDLVEAVYTLHEADITHNDIRPSTVYYSLSKKCYILGSYACCSNQEGSGEVVLRQSSRKTISKMIAEVNKKQFDIHLLGMTLLSAFYLCEIIDLEVVQDQNRKLIEQYEILKLINSMLAPPEKRATIQQIRKKLPRMSYEEDFMQQMIQSMNHRERPTPLEAIQQKVAISYAYQHLGLWNQWKKQYEESYQLMEKQYYGVDQADGLMQLALIDYCRGDFRSSDNYAKQAAVKYRDYGKRQLEQNGLGAAQSYYKKAVSCAKFYQLDPDPDLALSLTGLSCVHRDKGGYQYAKTLAIAATAVIAKAEGKNTIQYGHQHLHEASLQIQTGNYEGAQKMIQHCLNLAERVKDINYDGSIALKGAALVLKAKNYDYWGDLWGKKQSIYEQHKILDKGKSAAKQAVQTFQCIEQDHHLQLADVVRTVGLINMKRRNYYQSIRQYTRAIQILQTFESEHQRGDLRQRAQLLCLRGDAHSCVGQFHDSIKDYLEALKIYKQRYGSHHNKASALAFWSLAKIYAQVKLDDNARECIRTAKFILSDVTSRQDPKYIEMEQLESTL